jgi:hypothetical protein
MSSMIASASRKISSPFGTRAEDAERGHRRRAMSVAIGMPQPRAAGPLACSAA